MAAKSAVAAATTVSSAAKKTKSSKAGTGAPSQHNQSSRKGKKAWRKNVDIQEVEEALEGMREEERVVGTSLQKLKDTDLFQVDVQGDAQVKKYMRFSATTLTSTKILTERSAVPAVFSRPSSHSNSQKRKSTLSHEEKERLLRIGKRPRKGPFNSIVDPTEDGSALAEVTEAVKSSGRYDVWGKPEREGEEEEEVKDGLEYVTKKPVKAPTTSTTHPALSTLLPAVPTPHLGTSYNPPLEAHQELLIKAHEDEEKRVREETRFADIKEKMGKARIDAHEDAVEEGVPPGMMVQKIGVEEEEEEGQDGEKDKGGEEIPVRKAPARKTKQQKAKAAKLLAEKRLLLAKTHQKRLLSSLSTLGGLKSLHKASRRLSRTQESEAQARKVARMQKLRTKGMAGEKLGRHKVPGEKVDVQLGEDLSESFRGLKTEGNLFRDRFLSMQQRALIEPRVPVLPKKRRTRHKEYEKHAWKRFE